jgi:hypothetical protein
LTTNIELAADGGRSKNAVDGIPFWLLANEWDE